MKRLSCVLSTLASLALLAAWGVPGAHSHAGIRPAARATAGGEGGGGRRTVATPWDELGRYAPIPGSPIALKDIVNRPSKETGVSEAPELELEPRSERPIPPSEVARLQEEAKRLPPSPRVQQIGGAVAKSPTSGNLKVTRIGDGIDGSQSCRTPTGAVCNPVPPDTQMAVGASHIVTVVNVAIEAFDKAGHLLSGPTYFRDFFDGVDGCAPKYFDPNVVYDEVADRFIIGIDVYNQGYCIAASATGDPTGTWYRYFIPTTTEEGDFFDFPQLGVGRTAVYLGATIFLPNGVDTVGRAWAIRKTELYAGRPITVVEGELGTEQVPQPAILHGAQQGTWPRSGPHLIITNDVYDGATYAVWAWNNPFGGGQLTRLGAVDLNKATGIVAGFPPNAPQKGGPDLLGNDWRPMDLEYRNGVYWTINNIACNPGHGTVSCTRWAVFEPFPLHVLDAGVFASDRVHRTYSDLAVDACGNVAMGYTIASVSTYPGIAVTGRRFFDPPGQVRAEQLVLAGQQTYSSFDPAPVRWGDYGEVQIDPNGRDFYFYNEYAKAIDFPNSSYGSYLSKLSFNCQP
jgi:hypothetical protein